MSIAAPLDTPLRNANLVTVPVAASTHLYPGGLGARDASGNLVPASDTAGLRVVGRIEVDADNSLGGAGAISAQVRRGVLRYANSSGDPLAAADIGNMAFVENDSTVNKAGGTNKIHAGKIIDLDANGVWIDTSSVSNTLGFTATEDTITDSTGGTAATPSAGAVTVAAVPAFAPSVAWNGSSVYPSAADATAIAASITAAKNALATVIAELVKVKADLAALAARGL